MDYHKCPLPSNVGQQKIKMPLSPHVSTLSKTAKIHFVPGKRFSPWHNAKEMGEHRGSGWHF